MLLTGLQKCCADIERTRSLTTGDQKLLHTFQQGTPGQQGNIVHLHQRKGSRKIRENVRRSMYCKEVLSGFKLIHKKICSKGNCYLVLELVRFEYSDLQLESIFLLFKSIVVGESYWSLFSFLDLQFSLEGSSYNWVDDKSLRYYSLQCL